MEEVKNLRDYGKKGLTKKMGLGRSGERCGTILVKRKNVKTRSPQKLWWNWRRQDNLKGI